jgi:TRAP-type mannitol/chloroaromatic compound transport system permease small subunit
MQGISKKIDALNDYVGRALSWLTLFMVLVTFLIVVLRYVFNVGWIWLQETVNYMHSFVFLGAAGYVLLKDAHVRVDIFYRDASARAKAWVNLLGVIFLLLPICGLLVAMSFYYVGSSWRILEGSQEAGGIDAVYILKSLLIVYPVLLGLQGFSILCKSINEVRSS